jgi:type II secretory pathway pseudopilin PulG
VTKRDRIVLGVVGLAAVIAAFWLLALSPKREQASQLEQQTAEETKRRDEALARVRAGEEARRSFAADYATVARLGKAVPVTDQTPSLLYQLESVAEAQDVDFRSMKVRTSGAASAPAANGAQPVVSGSKPTTVPEATQAAAAVAPPGSAVGPAGFPTMPFTFKFEGEFFRMERLLSAIERFTSTVPSGEDVDVRGRLVTVDGFALVESKIWGFPRVNASVAATAYVLPPGEGTFAGAGPDAPSGAGGSGQTADAAGAKPPTATATAGGIAP